AETCVEHVNGAIDNPAEVSRTLYGQDGYAWGLAYVQNEMETVLAQAILAQQDAENLDTLDAFLPPGNTKAHTVLQTMREKKKAEVEHLLEKASAIHARMTNIVVALCARAEDKPNSEEALRTALDPEAPNNGASDIPPAGSDRAESGPPPGGWPNPSMPPPPDNGSSSPVDDSPPPPPDTRRDGDDNAAIIGGLLLGGAIVAGSAGGHHHHDGG